MDFIDRIIADAIFQKEIKRKVDYIDEQNYCTKRLQTSN